MPITACPFCFTKVDTTRLAYQCTNRGTTTCVQDSDPKREDMTGSSARTYPTFSAAPERGKDAICEVCGGPARRRACPNCHTAVPSDFVGSDSPMIAIVGSKGSGKTVLMTTLGKRLRENVSQRFNSSVRIAADDPDQFSSVDQYIAERENPLFKGGKLPGHTQESKVEKRRPVMLLWQGEKKKLFGGTAPYSAVLSFVDTAGEDLNNIESAFTLRYLTVCDSLIVALDPFALPGARDTIKLPSQAIQSASPMDVLGRVTDILRTEHATKRGKKLKIPVAIVFTKIDAFFPLLQKGNPLLATPKDQAAYDDQDGRAVHEHMRAMLHSWGAGEIDTHLRLNYSDFRFFGVSALGAEPDYATSRVAAGGVRPHRVEDPMLWLLAKEGAVESV